MADAIPLANRPTNGLGTITTRGSLRLAALYKALIAGSIFSRSMGFVLNAIAVHLAVIISSLFFSSGVIPPSARMAVRSIDKLVNYFPSDS